MRGVSALARSANISPGPPSSLILIRRGSVTSRTLASTASSSCSRGCWTRRLSAQSWRRSARRFSASARLTSASRALAKASRGVAAFSPVCSADFCSVDFAGCGCACTGCTAATLLAGFSSTRTLLVERSRVAGRRCRLRLRLRLLLCRRGSRARRNRTRHRLRRYRRDGYRLSRHPAFQLGHP